MPDFKVVPACQLASIIGKIIVLPQIIFIARVFISFQQLFTQATKWSRQLYETTVY